VPLASIRAIRSLAIRKNFDMSVDFLRQVTRDLRWTRLFGQFGGEVKLIPGFDYAASWRVSAVGASPDSGRISIAL
jgi:hypothetical protein